LQTLDIKDFLSPADARVKVRASDKRRLLQELAKRAAAVLNLPAEPIFAKLLKREELGSTGTGSGVAIPHARMLEINKPFGMLVRLKRPVDFQAIDNEPVDIVFLLLLPAAQAGDQLTSLAVVARKLRDKQCVSRLRDADNNVDLYRAMVL
jgi:nitrogen PTS system EIIA component